jgi:hypothetical protein
MKWEFFWFLSLLNLFLSCGENKHYRSFEVDLMRIHSSFLSLESHYELFYSTIHSLWQSTILLQDSSIVNIITHFHSYPLSLHQRRSSPSCDLVTWVIETNGTYLGQVTCFWSLYSFDHCGELCKFPIIPSAQTTPTELSYFHFLSRLASFSSPERTMLVSIIPFDSTISRRLSPPSLSIASPSSPSSASSSSSSSSSQLPATTPWKISSTQKLFSPDGLSYDNFGISLGYHSDIAIVGAVTRDHGGRVFIYHREGNNFLQDPMLLSGHQPSASSTTIPAEPSSSSSSATSSTTSSSTPDFFGWSIELFDRTIAVGAYQTLELTSEVQSVGAVYVFCQLYSGWNIESFLRIQTPAIAQAAPAEEGNNNGGGGKENRNNAAAAADAVTVEEGVVIPKYDHFGWSLGLSDSYLIVGAYGDDDQGTSSGAVYSFERINGFRYQWTVTQKLLPSDGSSYDNFGWSVAMSSSLSNLTVIGAYGDRHQNQPMASGSVYIFRRHASSSVSSTLPPFSSWTQIQKLFPSDSYGSSTSSNVGSGFYGWSVDIWSDQLIAVGSKSSTSNSVSGGNGVYLYRHQTSDGDWELETKLIPPANRILPNYGTSVSVDKDTVIVGAHRDLSGGIPSATSTSSSSSGSFTSVDANQWGSAFVYTTTSGGSGGGWTLLKELNTNTSTERNMKFGSNVKVFGDILLISALLGDGAMADTGTVFVFIRSIDISSLGHPLSGSTYFTLVLFLPLLFLGTCCVITFARLFMKPEDHTGQGSSSGGGSGSRGEEEDWDSLHSTHRLMRMGGDGSSRGSGGGGGSMSDDEESLHTLSISGLKRYQFIR